MILHKLWLLFLVLCSQLQVTVASVTIVKCNEECIQEPNFFIPRACQLRGSCVLTVFGNTSSFSSNKADNSVVLTRLTGTSAGPDEPFCDTQCPICTVDPTGTQLTCALQFIKGVSPGNFTLAVTKSRAPAGSMTVSLSPTDPPVVASVDCGLGSYKRGTNCTNGMPITIWGSNFDYGLPWNNIISFQPNSYGDPASMIYPYCSSPYNVTERSIKCNLTYPDGCFGDFAVRVTKQGEPNLYESDIEVTVNGMPKTYTHTPTTTSTVTGSASATSTSTQTANVTLTASGTRSATSSASATSTSSSTSSPSPSLTMTASTTDTSTSSATSTTSFSATASLTTSLSPSDSVTGTFSATDTQSATSTQSASPTASSTTTSTSSRTSSATVSSSGTVTVSGSRTATGTSTRTASPTTSATASATSTPTRTSTLTVIPTHTPSPTPTGTSTSSSSPTATFSPTATATGTPVPPFSEWLRFTFEVDPDLWTPRMFMKFRIAVAIAAQINDVLSWQNIEVGKIRYAEDEYGHRREGFSVVQWRLIDMNYGVKQKSAEIVAMSMFLRIPAVDAIMSQSRLPYVKGSLARMPVPHVPMCRECVPNTEEDPLGLAAPMKCSYHLNLESFWASAWPSEITYAGCAHLLSYTFNIVEV